MSAVPEDRVELRLAAFGFAVDLVTAEVGTALERAGVPAVVVKGPAVASWLYAGDESRLYGDTDLLVRGADWERAVAVLERLGFEDDLGPLGHPRMESGSGHLWTRAGDGAEVDLHRTLFGVGAGPEAVWTAFSDGGERRQVGGAEVALPPYPARLLHVVLHAVQHGGEVQPKSMLDLETALARVPEPTWREARDLAVRLRAEQAFAVGLGLTAAGRRLAARLGVGDGAETGPAALRMARVPLAEGFAELAAAPGWGAKASLARRELFPNRAFMRWWSPLARRGPRGLLAAHVWRLAWLAWHSVPGLLAWRRATRGS